MPRLAGLNVIAVLAAAAAMYFIGFVFYGLIFEEVWSQQMLENHGLVAVGEGATVTGEALAAEMLRIPGAMEMAPAMSFGFVISLLTATGIAAVLGMVKPSGLGGALRAGLVLWAGFAATTLAYNVVYSSESRILFGIDLAHLLLGYLAASAVIFLIDGKAMQASAQAR